MRVAIVTESFPPDLNGVAHSVVRVADHLVRRGHHPVVIAPAPVAGTMPTTSHDYPVVRVPSVSLPRYRSFRVGLPTGRLADALAPNGELLIGYVGRLAVEKRVDLLSAVCRLPGVRVVVVGDGPARREVEAALPGARFVGARHGNLLARLYASLDVFAHTGPYETFGQTVQEAMASGLPVVAPAAGGPLDLVTPGVTGTLVPPHDPDALATAVAELVADPERRRAYGAAGRAAIAARSWAAVGDELLGYYAGLLGGGAGVRTGAADLPPLRGPAPAVIR